MAKKVVTHTRDVGGLEAPRNSLEIPIETSYGIYSGRDNILYAYHVNKESSEKNCCSTEAPIKKLTSEEICKGSKTRQSAPSVVARLMGVDMLPFDSKPAPQLVERNSETPAGLLERSKKGSNSSQQLGFGSFGLDTDKYSDQCSSKMKSSKPKPREHPQEEELQKFKKEFEAWQAARFKQCSKVMEFDCAPSQLIAQEDLLREKMFLYVKSKRVTTPNKLMEPKDLAVAAASDKMPASRNWEKKSEYFSHEAKESLSSNRSSRTDYKASQLMNYESDNVSAPTKIVILRPGPDRMGISEDSWNTSPSSSEERGSIKDFLEEVKERLKTELQGKGSNRTTTVRGGGIETPYREKPTEPREIAQRIAQQVRDSVTRDFGMNLLRSESTRSYRSEIHLNRPGSPEFINKDTRRFLTEKLRNILKGETHGEVSNNSSGLSVPDYKNRAGRFSDTHIEGNMVSPECNAFGLEKQSRLLKLDFDERDMPNNELSPRNLIRSLSAPVSGSSFGKLLLEDRHMLTGAQIRRKHEVVKKVSLNPKKKKERFSIRERVSSFRYSLTLRGRLFHRRVQSMEGSQLNKHDLSRDISSGPTIMKSFYTHENSTEVPPSPASVCSSVHEDFWRLADYSSPTSSAGIHKIEDYEMPHDFREISSNLNELRRKLNHLEGAVPAETIHNQQPNEVELEIQDQAEAYIRDLLVASGLYHGSSNVSLSKWDPLGKPISNQVFEEVEESYRQKGTDNEMCKEDGVENINHKLLLELLNETLPAILKPPTNMPRYMKAIGVSLSKPLYGRKLLFHVWETIKSYVHPPTDRFNYDLDNMLARDVKCSPLSGLIDDDINALGRDLECQIIGDLLEEMVKELRVRI